ncbi:hypothetical protein CHR56_15900 [Rhizobium leguminosarum bv. viciae]|nr:hypothetical protein CHR56_15900 [Rhizobium leguminosarum bv. viciae]
MRLVKLPESERAAGRNFEQWGFGMIGAMVTTLPAFLFIPIWFFFSEKYRICKDGTEEVDTAACFFFGLVFGITVWLEILVASVFVDG